MQQHASRMQACIEECIGCHSICLETLTHCLTKGGRHGEAHHVRLLTDCAEICQTSANFMLRHSELHVHTCAACAEICERCARSCEEMSDDDLMVRCSEACRSCAELCREMSRVGERAA
jgi:hypothetical protein